MSVLKRKTSDAARVRYAHQLLFGRAVREEELKLALEYLALAEGDLAEKWTQYAQVLLASNELLMVD